MAAEWGAVDEKARIFVLFFYGMLCVSMCVSESSFFLDLTGIVCLLRFDGTGFFNLVLRDRAYVDLYWNLSTSFSNLRTSFEPYNMDTLSNLRQRIRVVRLDVGICGFCTRCIRVVKKSTTRIRC